REHRDVRVHQDPARRPLHAGDARGVLLSQGGDRVGCDIPGPRYDASVPPDLRVFDGRAPLAGVLGPPRSLEVDDLWWAGWTVHALGGCRGPPWERENLGQRDGLDRRDHA